MPASYLTRHRPICDVLNDIRELALSIDEMKIVRLCDEAVSYAQRMSAQLAEYKDHVNAR